LADKRRGRQPLGRIDSANNPHISYFEYDYCKLKYAYWNGYTWSTQTVDEPSTGSGTVGNGSSIALDSSNRPQIAYRSTSPDQLKFARWNGTGWKIEIVDDLPVLDPSLVIDDYDVPFISYYDVDSANLKYAVWTISLWYKETVDASLNVGRWSSIALDSIGVPHISYYDLYWEDLKYAKNEPGIGWIIRTIDTVGNMGLNGTSLAFDSSDHPHISYNDATNHNLKLTKDPDETFGTVIYQTYDSNADLLPDSVKISVDINTNCEEPLGVSFTALLIEPSNVNLAADNYSSYIITGNQFELNNLTLTPPPGSPEGSYTIKLFLADEMGNGEDTLTIWNDAYLYPLSANLTGTLTGTVTDFDTGLPLAADIYVGEYEDYVTSTNATGQYSIEFVPGEYVITVKDSESSIYDSQTVNVTIIAETVTTQDFQLVRSNWVLYIQTSGIGTTDPPPGMYTWPKDTYFPVEAGPGEGWRLSHWLLDSVEVGSENPIQVLMDADHNLTVVFTDEPLPASTIESCNSAGDQKDYFDLGETVYVTGNGYSPSIIYNLYVVADTDWIDGMSIPIRVSGTASTVTSNIEGAIPSTAIWSNPQTIGKYDIVVDVNSNGVYDAGVDALDSSDVEVTAGMVIPEFSPLLFFTFFILLTFLTVFTSKKHNKNK
jgi:hypothetical protein